MTRARIGQLAPRPANAHIHPAKSGADVRLFSTATSDRHASAAYRDWFGDDYGRGWNND